MSSPDSIHCHDAELLLFEGSSTADLEQHLAACERCRSLAARLRATDEAPPSLAASVLERVGVSACERARDLLFGDASAEERELLEEHLEHCESCAGVVQADRWARATLPQLATLEPGEAFTAGVLARTSARRSRRQLYTNRLQRYLKRRQAPLELAYAVAVVCVFLIAPPSSPFHDLPTAMQRWLAGDPESGPRGAGWVEATVLPVAKLPARAVDRSSELTSEIGSGIAERADQMSWAADAFGTHAREFGNAMTEREWEELRPVWGEMQCDMRLMLRGARGRLKSPDERC